MVPALVPDGRQLGAVEVRDGGITVGGHSARRSGAKRCALEGWHITAIQHSGRWASSQVLEYVEEAYAEVPGTGQVAGGATVAVRRGLGFTAGPSRQAQGGEEQQALISEKLPNAVKQSVQTMSHLPSNGQDIGQEELFVLALTSPANTAPSHAWSTRCGWYFAAQGFQLLRRSQVEEASYDTCKRCWKLEDGQPAALPGEAGGRLPERSCLERR